MAATTDAALAAVFSPGCAIPRGRCAPKTASRPSYSSLQPCGCGRRRGGSTTSIEAAIGAAEINERRLRHGNHRHLHEDQPAFTGSIQTVGLKAKVAITPIEKRGETAPDYRAFVGKVEIGAGWARTSKGGSRVPSASSLTTRASRLRSTQT